MKSFIFTSEWKYVGQIIFVLKIATKTAQNRELQLE